MLLAILWLYGSAPCCEWQPHLKWFTHTGRKREQSSMKYRSFPARDKTRQASLPSILQRTARRGKNTPTCCLWKVVSLRKTRALMTSRHNKTAIKTSESCWYSVTTRQVKPGHRQLTAVKLYPLARGGHKGWRIQKEPVIRAALVSYKPRSLYLFNIITEV